MPRASILAILVSLLGSTLAVAQRCQGFPSFQRRPVQLFVSGLFGDESRSYAAGVAVGSTGVFGELELGAIDVDAFSASSSTLDVGAGFQVPINQRGTAHLCPTAKLGFARGPKDINGTGIDYRETDFSLGVAVGVIASSTAQLEVVPTGSIAFANANSTLTGASGSVSSSQSFPIIGLGVGFVFGRAVSITPSISRALGASGASTTLGIRVAFVLGGARTSVVPTRATSCAGLASTDTTVYDTTQVTERPSLRNAPEPWFPSLQREFGIEGRVIMAVVIGPDGAPDQRSVRIVQNVDPAIDHEALRWIQSVSYWPACRDGQPVRARIAQPLDFCFFRCRRGNS